MIISKIDGTICKNKLGLSIHLKKYGMTTLDYLEKYEEGKRPHCPYCDDYVRSRGGRINSANFNITCGKKECMKEHRKNIPVSDNLREKMRSKRIEYLSKKENFLKTGWGKMYL